MKTQLSVTAYALYSQSKSCMSDAQPFHFYSVTLSKLCINDIVTLIRLPDMTLPSCVYFIIIITKAAALDLAFK